VEADFCYFWILIYTLEKIKQIMSSVKTFKEFLSENSVNEGGISNLYVLAKESKNLQDFIKKALDMYEMLKDDKSTRDFLEEIYNEGVNENADVNERMANDYAFEVIMALRNLAKMPEIKESGCEKELKTIIDTFEGFRKKYKL
jgi:hypothetical protein